MEELFVVIDEEGNVQAAFYDEESAEAMTESHGYEMRERASEELGLDGDGNEKDLRDAEIYAGQNYPCWYVVTVSKEACVAADGEDLTLSADGCGDIEVNSTDVLEALNRDDEVDEE